MAAVVAPEAASRGGVPRGGEDDVPFEAPALTGYAERGAGRRPRRRRGRRPAERDDGGEQPGSDAATSDTTAVESAEELMATDPDTGVAEPPQAQGSAPRPEEWQDESATPDGRTAERPQRRDGRGWREWREQVEPRDYRDQARHTPRDRTPPARDRLPGNARDGREGRDGRGAAPGREAGREPGGYREASRDNGQPREAAGYREAGYRDGQNRERFAEAAPSRPVDVVTRGYVVTVDPNQNQWQLRVHGHLPSLQDAVIPMGVVRANGLRPGDEVVGLVRGAAPGRRYGELLDVQSINGVPLEQARQRPRFDDLTPIYPDRHMRLERPDSVTARLIDLVTPIGFGQRALIVSPPKAGKTTILKEIGRSVNLNYPNVKLITCLVGERPEEVTDLAKSLDAELISSTFDEAIAHHTELAEITGERARRLVESGFDVVVLLDSITRLARAYNLAAPGDSRSLSGGMATSALYPPKRFFGAARAFQEGGSLTVIATCLVDTNSRLDDVIYEELKGTGNMELVLDRRLSEERVFPAIDIVKSSTRREELLLQPNELTAVLRLRRALAMASDPINNTRAIIQQMERTKTNAEFLASLLSQSGGR